MGENSESNCEDSKVLSLATISLQLTRIIVKDSGLFWREFLNYNYYSRAIKRFSDKEEDCETSFGRESGYVVQPNNDEGIGGNYLISNPEGLGTSPLIIG